MSPEDAPQLNHGKLDMQRDVIPLIDELKSKWKAKIATLHGETDKVS